MFEGLKESGVSGLICCCETFKATIGDTPLWLRVTLLSLLVETRLVDPLTELLRTGAEQLIYQAVEEELAEVLARHSERRLRDGRAGVVRNGYLPSRELQTGMGPVTVKIPKVRAKTGEAVTFRSALAPPYVRKTKTAGSGAAVVVFERGLEW